MASEKLTATLPDGAVDYRDVGSGVPLLFFHGVLANGRLWDRVVPLLAGHYRCVVPDWPLGSHSHAMAEDADLTPPALVRLALDFMDEVGLNEAVLVGNDTGGALCQMLAADHPERVTALVLTPCDAFEVFPPRALFAALKVAAIVPGGLKLLAESMRFKLAWRAPVSLAGLAKSRFERDLVDDWFGPCRDDPAIRRDTAKVIRGISNRYTILASRGLAAFDKPTLIAWPRATRFFRYELAERLARTIPNSRLVPIPDSYTFVSLDQPEVTAELIASFLSDATGRVAGD